MLDVAGRSCPCVTINLSASGVLLRTSAKVAIGQACELGILSAHGVLRVSGSVVRVNGRTVALHLTHIAEPESWERAYCSRAR